MGVLEMNYENDLDGMLGFFSGDSAFYEEFDALLRERVRSAYAAAEDEPQEEE